MEQCWHRRLGVRVDWRGREGHGETLNPTQLCYPLPCWGNFHPLGNTYSPARPARKYLYIIFNKKAVLSQRWPRDARYISRSWAVAEIWPFEIIQDGGDRRLEFIRIENSAIRSAVPVNPTLEQNMKWIGRPVAEISSLEIFPTWWWPPSWICSNRK